jgi:hypothetical protein
MEPCDPLQFLPEFRSFHGPIISEREEKKEKPPQKIKDGFFTLNQDVEEDLPGFPPSRE